MVGVDTESEMIRYRPNVLRIIQIATFDAVLIYRMDRVSQELVHLLTSDDVIKYTIGNDQTGLGKRFNVAVNAFVDIQPPAQRLMGLTHLPSTQAMSDQYAAHLNYRKEKHLQMSQWGQWPLRTAQVEYAAKDALVALAIGCKLDQMIDLTGRTAPTSLEELNRMTLNVRIIDTNKK